MASVVVVSVHFIDAVELLADPEIIAAHHRREAAGERVMIHE